MGKFKNYENACSNPFLMHKKVITVGLRSFTREMKNKFDQEKKLENEKYVCTNCFNKINKLGPEKSKLDRINSTTSSSSSSNVDDTETVPEEFSILDDTNETLKTLFVSPLKSRKKIFVFCTLEY